MDSLTLFIGTWNMGGRGSKDVAVYTCLICIIGDASPPLNLDSWLLCEGLGKELPDNYKRTAHDIYAIGSQVCVCVISFISPCLISVNF